MSSSLNAPAASAGGKYSKLKVGSARLLGAGGRRSSASVACAHTLGRVGAARAAARLGGWSSWTPPARLARASGDAVGAAIASFLTGRRATSRAIGPELDALTRPRRGLHLGRQAAASGVLRVGVRGLRGRRSTLPDAVLTAAASLDLLHVSALVHDDVMDASDTRRGVPAAHRQFEADHAGGVGRAATRRRSGGRARSCSATCCWCGRAEMFESCGAVAPDATRAAARPYLEAVRTEVTAGQYLDVAGPVGRPATPRTRTPAGRRRARGAGRRAVVTYKSACYTVERPLHIGGGARGGVRGAARRPSPPTAARSAAPSSTATTCSASSGTRRSPARSPARTCARASSPCWSSRRSRTPRTPPPAGSRAVCGRPDLSVGDVDDARQIIVESGAQSFVEHAIEREYAAALGALAGAPLNADGILALTALADAAVKRAF